MTNSILDKVITSQAHDMQEHFSPVDFVSLILSWLTSREAQVIRLRFGLDGDKPQTLEKIGKQYQITRERVRQIERSSVVKIKDHNEFEALIKPVKQYIVHDLLTNGGARNSDVVLSSVFAQAQSDLAYRQALTFIINHLIDDIAAYKAANTNAAWHVSTADVHLYEEALEQVVELLKLNQEPLVYGDLWNMFADSDFYGQNKEAWLDKHPVNNDEISEDHLRDTLLAYLEMSTLVDQNPFEEWGLAKWPTIKPKRMSDKIYLVLKKNGKPLHFNDITALINSTGFDHKKAHAPTVHNELILDKRFVLVGRGIYALKEWGYKEGVVSEVIAEILNERGVPMTREEILEAVSQKRIVKRGTIYLSLSDKDRFVRHSDGRYSLKPATESTEV